MPSKPPSGSFEVDPKCVCWHSPSQLQPLPVEEEYLRHVLPVQQETSKSHPHPQCLSSCLEPGKGRYNVWHDSVFASLVKMVKKHLPTTAFMSVDLPGAFNFPLHIGSTSVHPDIVLWPVRWYSEMDLPSKLTVCLKTSFEDAVKWKEDQYSIVGCSGSWL